MSKYAIKACLRKNRRKSTKAALRKNRSSWLMMSKIPRSQIPLSLKNMKTFRVSQHKSLTSAGHFPKPYTKAEQRLFKIDDSKLSETTDEDESSGSEEVGASRNSDHTQQRGKSLVPKQSEAFVPKAPLREN